MSVKAEVEAIMAGTGTVEEKRVAIANLKAQRHSELLPSMQRPFSKECFVGSLNAVANIRFDITEVSVEQRGGLNLFRIVATAQVHPNGQVIIAEDDLCNPMYFVNPPFMVPDGEQVDPNTGEVIKLYREDFAESIRLMLAEKVRNA